MLRPLVWDRFFLFFPFGGDGGEGESEAVDFRFSVVSPFFFFIFPNAAISVPRISKAGNNRIIIFFF